MSTSNPGRKPRGADADFAELERRLRLATGAEVRFDVASRAIYATDASNYRQIPIGVVIPRTTDDVEATIALCRDAHVPVLGRGAGTSIAGQACNAAIVIDFSKYLNRVIEVDPDRRVARVQPGAILDDLRTCAEHHHLTFGPDPATHERCTFGGMIGNNSCGVHSVMAGRTSDNIEELTILTYDGAKMRVGPTPPGELERIVAAGGRQGAVYSRLAAIRDRYADLVRARYPAIPRRVSGYNLDDLLPENGFNVARALVGAEGTCITILEAKVRLVPSPAVRSLLVLGYPDVYLAADDVPGILEFGPVGLEGMDDYLRNFLRAKRGVRPEERELLPEGAGWLLVEFGGDTPAEADAAAQRFMAARRRQAAPPSMKLMDPKQEALVWEVRKSGLGATAFLPGNRNTWPGWEDAAVPPARLGEYLRDFAKLRERFNYDCAMYGHFGEGCVHMRIDFDLRSRSGLAKFVSFLDEAADLVVHYGGSLSGEHGDGQARAHLLPKMFGPELVAAFGEFKAVFDPGNMMNPGKLVDPMPPDSNLRVGPEYRPWEPDTHFRFPESNGQFSRATMRCVGVGKCRRMDGGTMCPSFMATREEQHSTRGRARMLQEMLADEIVHDGWRNDDVREALDLCLSCKGCKTDCPVNVDMATYKSEFLSHYYEGRIRPRAAYVMGLIHIWARVGAMAPRLANFVTRMPGLDRLLKLAGGIAPERPIPQFATRPFTTWFRGKPRPVDADRPKVILWADTFNNFFLPDTAIAAVQVLEAAGWRIEVPSHKLCCGRPLYDYGFLDLAKRLLRRVLAELKDEIEQGTPVVVLEPSCAAVFRDELVNLFPDDPLAVKLSQQTYVLAEFLEKKAPGWQAPRLGGKALFHGHCHQKATAGTGSDRALLESMGLDVAAPETGCCGMAGSFGFRKEHYPYSVTIAERVLLPLVRELPPETLIVTDGFSCREQIRQLSGREALHLAQVLRLAMAAPPDTPDKRQP